MIVQNKGSYPKFSKDQHTDSITIFVGISLKYTNTVTKMEGKPTELNVLVNTKGEYNLIVDIIQLYKATLMILLGSMIYPGTYS